MAAAVCQLWWDVVRGARRRWRTLLPVGVIRVGQRCTFVDALPAGGLCIAATDACCVHVLSPQLGALRTIGGTCGLRAPRGVAVDGEALIVCDLGIPSRLLRLRLLRAFSCVVRTLFALGRCSWFLVGVSVVCFFGLCSISVIYLVFLCFISMSSLVAVCSISVLSLSYLCSISVLSLV